MDVVDAICQGDVMERVSVSDSGASAPTA
jgi:hypothetical protein